MPSKNTIKIYAGDSYYHIYNRGANQDVVFHDKRDYSVFLSLFKRYLSPTEMVDDKGRPYKNMSSDISLISYCLMPNHFHLLCLNKNPEGIQYLMRSICTAYSMYYNRRYNHSGHVFQGIYKATLIDSDRYLQHISRYIHRNPVDYLNYEYSSYLPIVNNWEIPWLNLENFWLTFEGNTIDYESFVADYENYTDTLDEMIHTLADS